MELIRIQSMLAAVMRRQATPCLTLIPVGDCVYFCGAQPRTVAGFRGTVRYASVNAHKNKVGFISCSGSPSFSSNHAFIFATGNGSP